MMLRKSLLGLSLCGALALLFSLPNFAAPGTPAAEPAAVPLPSVKGPIPVTATSHPFASATVGQLTPIHLEKYGYVEEEYFLSGKANVYDYDSSNNVVVKAAGAPYVNRIIVRRPKDPSKFSGNVIVEPLNQSERFELSVMWMQTHLHMMEHGDVYVGVTFKPVIVDTLKKFDPERYASLSWANPLPAAETCSSGFGGDSSAATENGLMWDIFSQTGALLKSDSPSNPLKGYAVKYLYGTGFSQTGGNMITYIVAIHPQAVLANGKPIYDGYLVGGSSGTGLLNQCSTMRFRPGDPHNQIHANVPVIRFNTQTDYSPAARQPDDDHFRLYEIPGAAHMGAYHTLFAPAKEDVAKGGYPGWIDMNCAEPFIDDFPTQYIYDGFWDMLDRWVRDGTPPPHSDRIAPSTDGPAKPGPNGAVAPAVLDQFNNLQGGLRTPYVDVPTASYVAHSTNCGSFGYKNPFTPDRLKALYPTHADYVSKVDAEVDSMQSGGWLTKTDAAKMKAEAAKADIPPANPAEYEHHLMTIWEKGWLSEEAAPNE